MNFEQIRNTVGEVPYIKPVNARYVYDLIIREKLTNILELGIAHGTATCYMAAALDELGVGSITCVDLIETKTKFQPSPEDQLASVSLQHFTRITRTQTGYTWFLHDEIKRLTTDEICQPTYDLCIIDGPKNWTIDGFAFFLVDKILKEGGWIIFDDYLFTYSAADRRREATDGISHRNLSEAERKTPQIKEVFELLVKQHPNYSTFFVDPTAGWAIAQKTASEVKNYTIEYRETNKDLLVDLKKMVLKRLMS